MAKTRKKRSDVSPTTGKKKKKPRGKPLPKTVPSNTPQRKKAIEKFIKEHTKHPVPVEQLSPYSLKGHGGVPRFYETPELFIERAEQYFIYINGEKELRKTKVPADNRKGYIEIEEEVWKREPEPPTITGFALFMGFAGRQGLNNYKKNHKGFMDVVNYYTALVAKGYEKNLHDGKAIGSMFALKNIDNWQDRTEVYNDFSDNVVKGFNYITPKPPENELDPRRNDDNTKHK